MSTLVDANVLIDIIGPDPLWFDWSARKLAEAVDAGPILLNKVIYAETCAKFTDHRLFDTTLRDIQLERHDLPWEAAFLAGQVHREYRNSGGTRDLTLPDFLIGAHAFVEGHRLLSRDGRRYRLHFPDLDLITPDSHP